MKKILFALIALVTVLMALPVHAVSDEVYIGDKLILDGGFEAVCVAFSYDGLPQYQVDLSAPTYLPDKVTKIDTSWKEVNGNFVNGANLFDSYVSGEFVSVSDEDLNTLSWQPSVFVGTTKRKGVSIKAKILAVDPLNSNYKNNTIEWDLGNGVYRRIRIIEGCQQEYYIITKPQNGDFNVKSNVSLNSKLESNAPVAWDADGNKVDITVNGHDITFRDKGNKYPITIDPDVTFTTSSSDASIYPSYNAIYANVRTAATGTIMNGTSTLVRNLYSGAVYGIWRSYLYFDTSVLSGYVITAATVDLYTQGGTVYTDGESIQIQSGMPTYPHDPLVAGDYDLTNYVADTNCGSKVISTFVSNSYNSISLDASGLAEINTTGWTKFCLRTSGDISNTAPTGENYVQFYTYEQGSGYRPRLVVTFTPTAPAIISVAASNLATEGARLNGTVTDDGSDGMLVENCEVRFGYGANATFVDLTGTATGSPIGLLPNGATYTNVVDVTGAGTFTITIPAGHVGVASSGTATVAGSPVALAAGANVIDTGATTGTVNVTVTLSAFASYTNLTAWVAGYFTGGNPYVDITGLTAGNTYYFNVQIRNTISTVTASVERVFTTPIVVADMAQFLGYPYNTRIKLNWAKAIGGIRTMIRYRTDTYPTTTADGTQVYFGTSTSYSHSGLTSGVTYYYSAWGETSGTYSANYINLAMTTGSTVLSSSPDTGVTPTNWWQEPNESFLFNIEPIYSVVNSLADSWGIPRGNTWLALALLFALLVGVGLYIAFKSASFALIVMAFVIAGFVLLHILPSFMLFMTGFLLLGAWSTRPTVA